MAPPAVFSKLRAQHRRTGSSPTSPQINQWQTDVRDGAAASPPPRKSDGDVASAASPVSPHPPSLPPIPRIASHRKPLPDDPRVAPSRQYLHNRSNSQPESDMTQTMNLAHRLSPQTGILTLDDTSIPPPPPPKPYPDSAQHSSTTYQSWASNSIARARTEDMSSPSHYHPASARLMPSPLPDTSPQSARALSADTLTFSNDRLAAPTGFRRPSPFNQGQPDGSLRMEYTNELRPPSAITQSSNSSPSPASSFSSRKQPAPSLPEPASYVPQASQFASNTAPKASKTRMLLNPMTLLMRRRNTDSLPDDGLGGHRNLSVPAMSLPDDYDPRIKGNVVHDFSAPKPRRNLSGDSKDPAVQNAWDDQSARRKSGSSLPLEGVQDRTGDSSLQQTPDKEHTPIFKENFDESEDQSSAAESTVRRESLANPAFLARWSASADFAELKRAEAANNENTVPSSATERYSKSTDAPSWRISSDRSTVRSSMSNDTRGTSPPQSPTSKARSSTASVVDHGKSSGPLKHIPSASSRFSFQMGNESSAAQERALEEKHKQKAAADAIAKAAASDRVDEEDYEDDYDDYDGMDDGLEEPIPGVNVDAEDEEDTLLAYNTPLASQYQQDLAQNPDLDAKPLALFAGSGTTQPEFSNELPVQDEPTQLDDILQSYEAEDDMYFDDGMIEQPPDGEKHDFDETVFDLPTTSPYDMPQRATTLPSIAEQTQLLPFEARPGAKDDTAAGDDDEYADVTQFGGPAVSHQASMRQPNSGSVLSQERLAAYQSALAQAANRAAAEGRFNRKSSISTEDALSIHPIDPNNFGLEIEGNGNGLIDYDDDEMEDDALVAAANAEALQNDEEGFYGREFGFYSNGGATAEFFNGGYLTEDQKTALARSTSGHNAVKEPNLTPITERSEFSQRNSFISVGPWNSSIAGSLPRDAGMGGANGAGGLAQIAANLGGDEDDMSLSQLIRLRRETFGSGGFGGSFGVSTSSLNGSNNSSPTSSGILPLSGRSDGVGSAHPSGFRRPSFGSTPGGSGLNSAVSAGMPTLPTIPGSVETTPRAGIKTDGHGFGHGHNRGHGHTFSDPGSPLKPFSAGYPQVPQLQSPLGIVLEADHSRSETSNGGGQGDDPTSTPLIHKLNSRRAGRQASPQSSPQSSQQLQMPVPNPPQLQPQDVPPQQSKLQPQLQSYAYGHGHNHHHSTSSGKISIRSSSSDRDRDSVAYVQETDQRDLGVTRWVLERRRMEEATGEVRVVGREVIEGGI